MNSIFENQNKMIFLSKVHSGLPHQNICIVLCSIFTFFVFEAFIFPFYIAMHGIQMFTEKCAHTTYPVVSLEQVSCLTIVSIVGGAEHNVFFIIGI